MTQQPLHQTSLNGPHGTRKRLVFLFLAESSLFFCISSESGSLDVICDCLKEKCSSAVTQSSMVIPKFVRKAGL